jgi:hypothetical protein
MSSDRVGRAVLELTTDGGSFFAGVDQARGRLKGLGTTVKQIQADATRLAQSFSGKNIIGEATKVTSVVTALGGASRLTIAEQARVNNIVGEAVQKYQALGRQAPKALLDLEAATRRADAPTSALTTRMVGLAAAVGSFFGTLASSAARRGISFVIQAGKDAVETADHLTDLASKTGLNAQTLQRMQLAGNQAGASLDDMSDSAYKLGIRIASGSTEVRRAVDDLHKYGLEWRAIRDARPDAQWEAVVAALAKVSDEQERNRLGTALFGKTFTNISAVVAQGYNQLAHSAVTSSTQQIEALGRANDAWDRWKTNTSTRIGNVMSNFVLYAEAQDRALKAGRRWQDLRGPGEGQFRIDQGLVFNARTTDVDLPAQMAKNTEDYAQQLARVRAELAHLTAVQRLQIDAAQKLGIANDVLEDKFGLTAGALALLNSDLKEGKKALSITDEFKNLSFALQVTRLRMAALTPAQRANIQAGIELGESVEDIAKNLHVSTQVVDMYKQSLKDTNKASDEEAKINKTLAESFQALAEARQLAMLESVQRLPNARHDLEVSVRDASFRRAEHDIEMAKRTGVAWQQVYAMERALSRAKLEASIDDAHREMEERTKEARGRVAIAQRAGQDVSAIDLQVIAAEEAAFDAQQTQMREDWNLTQQEIADDLQRTHNVWLRTWADMRDAGQNAVQSISDGFGNMLAGSLAGARTFKDEMLDIWRGIQRGIARIFSDILNDFIHRFLAGMVRGIAGAKLGQRLGTALAGGVPLAGGGGGVTNALMQAGNGPGGGLLNKLLGVGGGTATKYGLGQIAPGVIASSAADAGALVAPSAFLASAPALGSTEAGVMAGSASVPGAGGGLSFLSNPAFWTNPYTLLGIGGVIGGIALYKHLRKGNQANDHRDKFLAQFAAFDTKRDDTNPPGFYGLHALLVKYKRENLFNALTGAKNPKDLKNAETPIAAFLGTLGRQVKVFHKGGIVGRDGSGDEVLIKARAGEGVLTPQATQWIGGKSMIDALNAGGLARATGHIGNAIGHLFQVGRSAQRPTSGVETYATTATGDDWQTGSFGALAAQMKGAMSARIANIAAATRMAIPQLQVPALAPAGYRTSLAPMGPVKTRTVELHSPMNITINASSMDGEDAMRVYRKHIRPALKEDLIYNRNELISIIKRWVD